MRSDGCLDPQELLDSWRNRMTKKQIDLIQDAFDEGIEEYVKKQKDELRTKTKG